MTNTGEAVEELSLGFTGERKFRKGLIVFGPTSDKHWLYVAYCCCSELRSCGEVEVAVRGSPSLISLMVSVDVKQH